MSLIQSFLKQNKSVFEKAGYSNIENYVISYLTPGFQASSHVLAFLIPPNSSKAELVAKFPRLPGDHKQLDLEVQNLNVLNLKKTNTNGVPRILAYESFCEHQLMIQTMLPGKLIRPATLQGNAQSILAICRNWLLNLHSNTKTPFKSVEKGFERVVGSRLETLAKSFVLTDKEQVALENTASCSHIIEKSNSYYVFEHGDFAPPNLLLDNKNQLGVVDWELADPLGLPLADWVFFLIFAAIALENSKNTPAQVQTFREYFFENRKMSIEYLKFVDEADIDRTLAKPLFVLAIARYVANMIVRLRGKESRLSDKTIAWLRENRYYQIWITAANEYNRLF